MSTHFIEEKTEDALALAIAAECSLPGVTLLKGFSGENVALPALCILATQATPEVVGDTETGNWTVTVDLSLKSHFADTERGTNATLFGEVRDFIYRRDVVDVLNDQGVDFYAMLVTPEASHRTTQDHQIVSTQTITLYACASDVTNSSSSSSSSS